MQKKKKLSRVISFILTAVMALTLLPSTLMASAQKSKMYSIQGWGYDFRGSGLPKAYDPITKKNTNNEFSNQWSWEFWYFKTNGEKDYAYCLQLGVPHFNEGDQEKLNLDKVYQDNFSKDQRNYLKYATIYGYKGKTHYGYSWQTELVATQAMTWSISANYFDGTTTALSANEKKLLKAIIAPTATDKTNVENCYKKMKEEMLSHAKIPSGTSKSKDTIPLTKATYTLKYNASNQKWETTVAMNSELAKFTVKSVSGVTFTVSGTKLKISATTDGINNLNALNGVVTFNKTKGKYCKSIDKCSPLLLRTKKGERTNQMKITYNKEYDPVSAYIKLTPDVGTFKLTKVFSVGGTKVKGTAAQYNSVVFQLSHVNSSGKKIYMKGEKTADGAYECTGYTTDAKAASSKFKVGKSGTLTVKNLPTIDLKVSEIATAKDFKLAKDKTVTVKSNSTVSSSVNNAKKVGSLSVTKRFLDSNGKAVTSVTSKDVSDVAFNLTYTDESGKTSYVAHSGGHGNYTYHSLKSYNKSDATLKYVLKSNKKLDISNLPVGTYKLIEISASADYKKSKTVSFTVKSNATTSVNVNNTKKTGDLIVQKKFRASGSAPIDVTVTAKDISDISFYITHTDSSGKTSYVSHSGGLGNYRYASLKSFKESDATLKYVLNAKAEMSVANLPVGKYKIIEVTTADDFKLSSPRSFTIEADKTKTQTVINREIGKSIDIVKSADDWIGQDIIDTDLLKKIYAATTFIAYTLDSTGNKSYINAYFNPNSGEYTFTHLSSNLTSSTTFELGTDSDSDLFGIARINDISDSITSTIYFEEISSYDGFGYEENIQKSEKSADVGFNNRAYYFNVGFNKYAAGTTEYLSEGVFGLYAAEDIFFNGNLIYAADEEIEAITSTGETTYFETALPAGGKFYIKEIIPPCGYVLDDTRYEVISNVPTELTNSHLSDVVVDIENDKQIIPEPEIKTSARDSETNTKLLSLKRVVIDTITLTNIAPDTDYVITTKLVDKATGEFVKDVDGNDIVVSTDYHSPSNSENAVVCANCGEVYAVSDTLDVEIDVSNVEGLEDKDLVVYEYMTINDELYASHEDINDEDQTVKVPKAQTKATDKVDGDNVIDGTKTKQTIIDTVTYKNLIVGETYSVTGKLAIKGTDDFVTDENGEVMTVTVEFVAENSEGTIDVEFEIDASKYAGKKLVAFETVSYEGVEVAVHADIEDEEQTITVSLLLHIKTVKVNADNKEQVLEGAEITIFNKDGTIAKDIDGKDCVGVTNEKGEVDFTVLYSEDNTYYAKETKAPLGFEICNDMFEVVVTNDRETEGVCLIPIQIADFAIILPPKAPPVPPETPPVVPPVVPPETPPVVPPVTPPKAPPKTGDNSMLPIALCFILGTSCIVGFALTSKRKNKNTDEASTEDEANN